MRSNLRLLFRHAAPAFGLAASFLGNSAVLAAQEPQGSPEGLALIVAIEDYSSGGASEMRDLEGCGNDAERVQRLLTSRFGFAADQILVLRDAQATHAGILRAFREQLIERAGKETEVVFWFSGHGSQVPDASGQVAVERGKKDSTLVAWDSRAETGVPDLSDDELFSLLAALCARTPLVTVVTDCCHSGGVTRGPAARRGRWAEDALLPTRLEDLEGLWPADLRFYEDGDPARPERLPYVHIAACDKDQEAQEYRVGAADGTDGTPFGALTWFLTDAMESMEPGTTYAQLVQATSVRLAAWFEDQDVQAEGPLERQVFQAAFGAPLPGFAGLARDGSRGLDVQAGALQLLQRGQTVEVRTLEGGVLGNASIDELEPYSSWAVWTGAPPALAATTPVRVLPVGATAAGAPGLFLGGAADDPMNLAVREAALPGVRLTTDPHAAVYQFFPVPGDVQRWQLASAPAGRVLWDEALDAADWPLERRVAALCAYLRWEDRYRSLLELADFQGGLEVQAEFRAVSDADLAEWRRKYGRPELAAADLESAGAALLARDQPETFDLVELVVAVDAPPGVEVHVTVLCASEDRKVFTVWPRDSRQNDNVLEGGDRKVIPIGVFLNEGWDESRPMRDRYLVIATATPADFRMYEQGLAPVRRGEPAQLLRGGRDELPPVISRALESRRLRGGARKLDGGEWSFGVKALDLHMALAER
ncbi:MAG TPA: caspase family protein [Planctomycetota bacterium]